MKVFRRKNGEIKNSCANKRYLSWKFAPKYAAYPLFQQD
jgi:hypothetical protein